MNCETSKRLRDNSVGLTAMIVFIGFLTYPVKKGHVKVNSMPWYDIILMLVGTSCFLYFAFNALPIIKLATRIQTHHVIIGAIAFWFSSSSAAAASAFRSCACWARFSSIHSITS